MKLFSLVCLLFATAAQAAPVTDVRLQNTGAAAQTAVPITFGQVFAVGDVKKADVLTGSLAGAAVPLQVDVKATHGDGSVRHAIISAVVPKLPVGTTQLAIATGGAAPSATPANFRDAAATANVTLTIAGVKYTASLADALAATPAPWLAGPVAAEVFADAPLKNAAGAVHPLLTVKYGLRWYPAAKAGRVEVIVENTKTWQPNADQFTYDVAVDVGGQAVYSKQALTHYHHSRWHQYFWTGAAPALHVQHNTAYLIASKAVSNYEQIAIPEDVLAGWGKVLNPDNTGPTKIGTVIPDMHNAGGRGDIGPLPDFSVIYLLTMDKRLKDVMLANADGSGSWNMHYRDETTGAPIRTDNDKNKNISTHPNAVDKPQYVLPIPRFTPNGAMQIYSHDPAHLPSLVFLPYIVSGERYYLEELQFWAATNPLETSPENHAGLGLMRWHQVRGQAWGMRTLGETAYITPDADPMKSYFVQQVANNINFYHQTYVIGNPNNLGAYDGSGEYSFFPVDSRTNIMGTSPWQDAFFTWSLGRFVELGFEAARPVAFWKSKYATGMLTDPGYCSILATAYGLSSLRDGVNGKVYPTFAALLAANYGGDTITDDSGNPHPGPAGKKFIDLPCGSQAQADYLGSINGFGWPAGRFVGYSDFVLGNPAIVQSAVAQSASIGAPNADKAWKVFNARLLKANYKNNPQWNIVPRDVVAAPPVNVPPAAKPGTITTPSSTKVAKLKGLTYRVFNPITMAVVKDFTGVAPSSKNVFTLTDAALVPGALNLSGAVIDPKANMVIVVQALTVK